MLDERSDEPSFPDRTMVARIYRVDEIEVAGLSGVSIEFDGVDAEVLEGADDGEEWRDLCLDRNKVAPFGLFRVVLEHGKFEDETDLVPVPGQWFSVTLSPNVGIWPAQHTQLTEAGYRTVSKGYIGRIEHAGEDDVTEYPPSSVGAMSPKKRKKHIAINGGKFPANAVRVYPSGGKIKLKFPVADNILVRDVGQASFATVFTSYGRGPLFHFDAGWPIAFNNHTEPPSKNLTYLDAPVILSHWDWDHLHGYYVFPQLQSQCWLTPVQHLGPGASRVAAQLNHAGRLRGFTGGPVSCGWASLATCPGPAGNRNQTGLALEVQLTSNNLVLLTGDADYTYATRFLSGGPYSGLIVTHHGAKFGGSPPAAHAPAKAVVSYGEKNVYHHPDSGALGSHVGWTIFHTAKNGKYPRGSRNIR